MINTNHMLIHTLAWALAASTGWDRDLVKDFVGNGLIELKLEACVCWRKDKREGEKESVLQVGFC